MRHRFRLFPAAVVALAACSLPANPTPPAPEALTSPLPPVEVVPRATALLAQRGFDITTSDARGGVVQAKRTRQQADNQPDVTCSFPPGSYGERTLESTLTISVTATPKGSGSAVLITGRVEATVAALLGNGRAMASKSCASAGTIERALAETVAQTSPES